MFSEEYNPLTYKIFPKVAIQVVLTLSIILSSISGCQSSADQNATPPSSITPTPTEYQFTATPTVVPIGSPGNPLVFGIVSELNDPRIATSSITLANQIADATGYTLTTKIFTNYRDLIKELESGKIHITWLPPLTYLYARKKGIADVVFISNRFGVYFYGAQFLANVSSGFTPYYDPQKGVNTAEASVALKQLTNRRPCWVEPQSASGYIIAASQLAKNKIPTLEPAFVQSHTAVIRALYIKGICDFGVTFSISGDPRTSSAITQDLPDVLLRIVILWRTEPVIPNISLVFIPGMQAQMYRELANAFQEQAKTANGRNLLTASAGGLQIDDLRRADDTAYDGIRSAVDELQLDLAPMIGK